jgi:hypothetical protein
MITRYALFEGQVHPGQTEAFRAAVLTEILPVWRAFPARWPSMSPLPTTATKARPSFR